MIENLNSNPLSPNSKQEGGFIRASVVRVLDDGGGYLLKTQSGREFAVRTEGSVSLSAGQNVLVNPSEGKIVVLPDGGSSDPSQLLKSQLLKQFPTDLFTKSELAASDTSDKTGVKETGGQVQTAQKSVDFAVAPEKIFEDGLYKTNSAKNRELVDKVLREISGEAKDYAAVRLSSVNGQQVVTAVTSENLQKVIEELHSNFASNVLRSLPVAFFEQLFTERGELNLHILKALDTQLQSRNISIDPASQVQLEKLNQWVRLIMDNPQLIEKLAMRIPLAEAQDVARQFQVLNAMSANFLPDAAKGSLSPEIFFLTEDKLSAAGLNRSVLIENLCTSTFSSAPSKLLDVLGKLELSGQIIIPQTTSAEAQKLVSDFLSKFPTIAYKELEMVHNHNSLSPKTSDAQISASQQESSKQPTPQALIKIAFSELTDAAVKALIGGDAKETAAVINTKTATIKEIINQIQSPLASIVYKENNQVQSSTSFNNAVSNTEKTEAAQRIIPSEIKADVLMKIMNTLEKTVVSVSDGVNKNELNFEQKAALLKTIHASVSSVNSVLPVDPQTFPVSQNFYERLLSMPKPRSDSMDTNALFSRITAAQESIEKLTMQLTNDTKVINDKVTGNQLLNFTHNIWSETEKIRTGFQEVFSSLDLQNRISLLESSNINERLLLANRQSIDSFRLDLMMDVSRALQEIFSAVKELNTTTSHLPENLRLSPETETALRNIVQTLEQKTYESSEMLTEKLKFVLKELTSMQGENTRALEQQNAQSQNVKPESTQSPQQNAHTLGSDILRSAIQNAARGLETLQLLSAQTRGAGDTQQQIVALPVKIGEEWTEVHVKFLKDRKDSKKKNSDGHVSVYLNVAPSTLGEVGAHLDFYPPANLKISFQFERAGTKKWFIDQSSQIREALSEAGLPGTVLEFRSKRIQKMGDTETGGGEKKKRKAGKIDIDA
ncbi:MAG: hypothetical protein FWE57_01495 [Chitinispirillia bacterium]|nr:hypothetical protein [Chitinispirillia bacterium]